MRAGETPPGIATSVAGRARTSKAIRSDLATEALYPDEFIAPSRVRLCKCIDDLSGSAFAHVGAGGFIMGIKHIDERQDCDGGLAGLVLIAILSLIVGSIIGLVIA
jgi:hypothetical protein